MNLPETICTALERHNLIPENTNVVIGVSGGADSVALLRIFSLLNIPCTVAHLNHGLRGDASDADEQFVRDLATELGLPLSAKSVNVRQLAESTGQSIEIAARQARHEFFEEFKGSVIVLAHHADDQAETFILKLARGAGTEGLSGMAFSQQIGPLRLIRPMLEVCQSDIRQWLEENSFIWREDASNSDASYLRNRVRHTILPMLEKELNPNIRETIRRSMNILHEENEWMDSLLAETNLEASSTLPLAARRRVLRNWLFEKGAVDVGFKTANQILSLIVEGKGTTVVELNDRQRVIIEYGKPRFEQIGISDTPPRFRLTTEAGTGWRKDPGGKAGRLPAEASFDAEKVGDSPIVVRAAEPGDRMAPFGMTGSRKLQDIFTDQKIPKARRQQIPVVVCREEIIWLPGYRTARGWEVRSEGAKSIHVRIEQNRTD